MPDGREPTSRPNPWFLAGALVLLGLGFALFPGDSQWVNDEPLLIAKALASNSQRAPAVVGLEGTRGVAYGPLPIWLYQLYLACSHDLLALVAIRAVFFVAVLGGALVWLGRTLGLWPYFAFVPLLSPYAWYYARTIWDNSFSIPVGALTVAAYVSYLARRRGWTLILAVVGLMVLPLIHLMSLALVVPLGLHFVVAGRRELRERPWHLAAPALFVAFIGAPYGGYLLTESAGERVTWHWRGWLFPFLGGRVLSAAYLESLFGEDWFVGGWIGGATISSLQKVSELTFWLVWAGMGVSAWELVRRARGQPLSIRNQVASLLLGVLLAQTLLNALSGKHGPPHYYNATWIVLALFAWLAVDKLAGIGWAGRVTAATSFALLAVLGTLAVSLHLGRGTRETYGPTLGNQIELARELARFSKDSKVSSDVPTIKAYPHALQTLRGLFASDASEEVARFKVEYRSEDPHDGRVRLRRMDEGAP